MFLVFIEMVSFLAVLFDLLSLCLAGSLLPFAQITYHGVEAW